MLKHYNYYTSDFHCRMCLIICLKKTSGLGLHFMKLPKRYLPMVTLRVKICMFVCLNLFCCSNPISRSDGNDS